MSNSTSTTRERDLWICTSCKWEGDYEEITKTKVFTATQEEPEEWLWYCPQCRNPDNLEEKYENANWCRMCEDKIVKHENDLCNECKMEALEIWQHT